MAQSGVPAAKMATFNPRFPATVGEVVSLGLFTGRGSPSGSRGRTRALVDSALDLMDIGSIRDKLIGELSGGQQQRVFLAKAMVGEPELIDPR